MGSVQVSEFSDPCTWLVVSTYALGWPYSSAYVAMYGNSKRMDVGPLCSAAADGGMRTSTFPPQRLLRLWSLCSVLL